MLLTFFGAFIITAASEVYLSHKHTHTHAHTCTHTHTLTNSPLPQATFCCDLGWFYRLVHIAVGGMCLCGVVIVMLMVEGRMVRFLEERLSARTARIIRTVRTRVSHYHGDKTKKDN